MALRIYVSIFFFPPVLFGRRPQRRTSDSTVPGPSVTLFTKRAPCTPLKLNSQHFTFGFALSLSPTYTTGRSPFSESSRPPPIPRAIYEPDAFQYSLISVKAIVFQSDRFVFVPCAPRIERFRSPTCVYGGAHVFRPTSTRYRGGGVGHCTF